MSSLNFSILFHQGSGEVDPKLAHLIETIEKYRKEQKLTRKELYLIGASSLSEELQKQIEDYLAR